MHFELRFEGSREMTSIVYVSNEDGCHVLEFRILSGAPEWIDF
jgi:hypothetical protein